MSGVCKRLLLVLGQMCYDDIALEMLFVVLWDEAAVDNFALEMTGFHRVVSRFEGLEGHKRK